MKRHSTLALLLVGAMAHPAAGNDAPQPVETDGPALFAEPPLLTAAVDLATRFSQRGDSEMDDGFYPKIGGMISGAGWITAGPGYRRHFFDGRVRFDAYSEVSWRAFTATGAILEFPLLLNGRLTMGIEGLWQDSTQLNYFGIGPNTPDEKSQYRLQTMNVVTYAQYKPRRWLALSSRVGWVDSPSVSSPSGPFKPDDAADALAAFPNDPGMTLAEQPHFLHGEIAIEADTRNFPGHPTRGGLYRASAGAYVADPREFSFRRYEVEGLQALPLMDRAWVLVLHGWGVFTQASPNRQMPFYLMPTLGGADTLRGYSNYRFHDRNLLLASAESRWPIFAHMDAAVFVDSGTVAARAGDLGLNDTVYGFGFRVHTHTATVARLDIAHNREGWGVLFRSSDVYDLDRLRRWVAAIPFVP